MQTKLSTRVILDKEQTAQVNEEDDLIAFLRELQVMRRYAIKMQSCHDRPLEQFLARSIGGDPNLSDLDNHRIKLAKAKKVRVQLERDSLDANTSSYPELSAIAFKVNQISFAARQQWDSLRYDTENRMVKLARLLPVWPWVQSISGIAELGLAVLVGEAGDIGKYDGPSKLWVRFGLGTFDGYRQGFVPKEITGDARKQAWIDRGYNPARRAEVWAFLDDVLFRHQWRGAKDDQGKNPAISKQPIAVAAHAIGPYGQAYGDRKEWNLARGLQPAHADKDARRFMAKRFIRDLWLAWREAEIQSIPRAA